MNLSKEWFKAALIRALKTFCQTAASTLMVGQAFWDVDWKTIGSVALTAAIMSILTSVAGLPEVEE